jgi:hypothetical protein
VPPQYEIFTIPEGKLSSMVTVKENIIDGVSVGQYIYKKK